MCTNKLSFSTSWCLQRLTAWQRAIEQSISGIKVSVSYFLNLNVVKTSLLWISFQSKTRISFSRNYQLRVRWVNLLSTRDNCWTSMQVLLFILKPIFTYFILLHDSTIISRFQFLLVYSSSCSWSYFERRKSHSSTRRQ